MQSNGRYAERGGFGEEEKDSTQYACAGQIIIRGDCTVYGVVIGRNRSVGKENGSIKISR